MRDSWRTNCASISASPACPCAFSSARSEFLPPGHETGLIGLFAGPEGLDLINGARMGLTMAALGDTVTFVALCNAIPDDEMDLVRCRGGYAHPRYVRPNGLHGSRADDRGRTAGDAQ